MPNPLSHVLSKTGIHINNADDPACERPAHEIAAMRVISKWSILESSITAMFVASMKEGATASAAIFATIRNQAGQRDAIKAALDANVRNEDLRQIIEAVFDVYVKASDTRNKLAH